MPTFPQIQVDPKTEYERKKDQDRERSVRADIKKIDELLAANSSESDLLDLHRYLDGKYQAAISGWGRSMYGYTNDHGFDYTFVGVSSLRDNLLAMKAKLEGFICGWNSTTQLHPAQNPDFNVTVNNTNNISISLSIEEAKQKIEDMPGLTDAEAEEIKGKIDELDAISKEDSSKKKKWEKVKPIIKFALDKSADVAITIMGLILQMKLGM